MGVSGKLCDPGTIEFMAEVSNKEGRGISSMKKCLACRELVYVLCQFPHMMHNSMPLVEAC
jgi:hypothetical protein